MNFNKKLTDDDWIAIKLFYNDDGTKKIYPFRKGVMQGSYYKKNWNNGSFDKLLFSVYNKYKKLLNELSKKKYGIDISIKTFTVKKKIGGLFLNGKKAQTISRDIEIKDLAKLPLKKQLSMIENLFNKDY